MIKLAAQVVPLKVDAEKEGRELVRKYKVRAYPTVLFLDAEGELFGRITGYLGPEPFAAQMTKFVEAPQEFARLQATLKERPEDGAANARLAAMLVVRGKLAEAAAAAAKAEKAQFEGAELAKAYSAIGDAYQSERNLDEAIRYYTKADAAARNPEDHAYAKVAAMFCYRLKGEVASARKLAEEVVAMKDAPAPLVEVAKRTLTE